MVKYITYNHVNFNNIGLELYKFAITLSIALNTNRTFVLFNPEYMHIIDTFINYKYKPLTSQEFNVANFTYIKYPNDITTDMQHVYIIFDNKCIYQLSDINETVRIMMSLLFSSNINYTGVVYSKINEIMNHHKKYEIDDYVCINIKKDNYDIKYYQTVYDTIFKDKIMLIFTDDINNTIIDGYMIETNENNKYVNFILLAMFNNIIIGDIDINYISCFAGLMGNRNKQVVINRILSPTIDNWITLTDY